MEAPTERLERAALGPQGEPCPECGSPLARDQRYCLTCGARRGGLSPVLSEEVRRPGARTTTTVATPAPVAAAAPWKLDAGLLAGVGCLLLALLVGVLIGRSGGGSDAQQASTPQVVTVGAAPTATPAGAAANVALTPDWPAGKRGFTVELQTLPKDGTDAAAVAAAKQAAAAKGAPDVGALDSDQYASLGGGTYVIYSGQYADRAAAAKALKARKGAFPGAKVVEVSDAGTAKVAAGADAATGKEKAPSRAEQAAGAKAIQDVQNASPEEYSKKSAQLPDELATPGKLPPKDTSKPAGGGTETESFK
jgi:hypothetical protein